MRIATFLGAAICFLAANTAIGQKSQGQADHVVLIVWDGLRPDFVTEKYSPTLWKLSREGVTFRNHHSVFPTSTDVNGTAIATGVYPARNGLMANLEYRPELDDRKPVDTADAQTTLKGDELNSDKYLACPTIAELVQGAGGRTAVAGTKTVALLFDRSIKRASEAARNSTTLFAGAMLPREAQAPVVTSLGAFPKKRIPNEAQDQWTTKALTESFWESDVPKFSLLWLSDPDFSEHDSAPGSPSVLAAIKSVDSDLATVLESLEAKKVRGKTDILVVSDHGFSTVERAVNVPVLLNAAGFKAATEFRNKPAAGDIMVVGNGGAVLFYVVAHDEAVTRRLVEWLQRSDFAGVIFSRQEIEGTFKLKEICIDTPAAPDVVMSFRWKTGENQFGVAGLINADWNRPAGKGTHATLSKFDLHNTLIAAGPDFRRGFVDERPTGNIDLAPTILHILGIDSPHKFDGRILSEAMTGGGADLPQTNTKTIEAQRAFPSGKWRQHLRVSRVGDTIYFDEGNAE